MMSRKTPDEIRAMELLLNATFITTGRYFIQSGPNGGRFDEWGNPITPARCTEMFHAAIMKARAERMEMRLNGAYQTTEIRVRQ